MDEMTPLCHLAEKYVTDKWSVHRYTPIYHRLFESIRYETLTLLEIGIGPNKGTIRKHGASLRMWAEYFPNARIFGMDIRKDLRINEGRIRSVIADQGDPVSVMRAALYCAPLFDIIIDDGSHVPEHQISSAQTLIPLVNIGCGFYIIEDVHTDEVFNKLALPFEIYQSHHPSARLAILKC